MLILNKIACIILMGCISYLINILKECNKLSDLKEHIYYLTVSVGLESGYSLLASQQCCNQRQLTGVGVSSEGLTGKDLLFGSFPSGCRTEGFTSCQGLLSATRGCPQLLVGELLQLGCLLPQSQLGRRRLQQGRYCTLI